MVFDFIVLLQKEDIKKINFSEVLVEWGGESFSQEPPQYIYNNSSLLFQKFLDIDYYKKYHRDIISNDLNIDEFVPFILIGNHMLELEKLINSRNPELLNYDIFKFLKVLSRLNKFAIFIEREEEYVDNRYYIKTSDELINKFCNCLKWESPEGALITKL